MTNKSVRVSIILPVYNQYENIKRNLRSIVDATNRLGNSEVIVVEDGSTDGSKELLKKMSKSMGFTLLSSPGRKGKGNAIKRGVEIACGEVIGYMDIDLAVPLRYLPKAVMKVEEGYDMVIGSRYLKGSEAYRSFGRLIESVTYNFLLRTMLGSRVKDHQCGFKFWRREFIKEEAKKVKDEKWFFDSEVIVRAERAGKRIYEMPVEWHESKDTTVKFSDIFYFLRSIFRARRETKKG